MALHDLIVAAILCSFPHYFINILYLQFLFLHLLPNQTLISSMKHDWTHLKAAEGRRMIGWIPSASLVSYLSVTPLIKLFFIENLFCLCIPNHLYVQIYIQKKVVYLRL
jgi:hypothetical protein